MKLTYLAIIVLVFFLGLTVNSFLSDITEKEQTLVINTTTKTINLNETNRLLKENQILLTIINEKELDCTATFNIPRIQFYPRTERKCRFPKEESIYGSSMQPFLYDGDSFYVERVKFEDLELGDVIIYKRDEKKIIHSITAIYEDFVITAGYNNLYEDHYVYEEEIKDRYCEK